MKKKRATIYAAFEKLNDPQYWRKLEKKHKAWAKELEETRKDARLTMRINSKDLARLKEKAQLKGLGYQTYIAEILKKAAKTK